MMTLQQFQERFHNEEACRSFLFNSRWPDGFCCPRCGHSEHYYIQTRTLYECSVCRAQTSVTAGTLMHRTKLPLQFWFLVIYMVAHGGPISAQSLAGSLQLNYRTALRMLRCVRHAMRKQNGSHPLSNIFKSNIDVSESSRQKIPSGQKTPSEDLALIGNQISDTNSLGGQTDVVTRAKQIMIEKVSQFTRLTYRSVRLEYFQSYVDEYYFRWVGRFDVGRLFFILLHSCIIEHRIKETTS